MKHNSFLKAIAIVLAAVALVAAAAGAMGMFALANAGLYNKSVEELKREKMENIAEGVAESLVRQYVATNLSGMTENALEHSSYFNGYAYYYYEFNDDLGTDGWSYVIRDLASDKVVSTNKKVQGDMTEYQIRISITFPKLVWYQEVVTEQDSTNATNGTEPDRNTQNSVPNTTRPGSFDNYDDCMRWFNDETGNYVDYYFRYEESPDYLVSIYLPKNYQAYNSNSYWNILILISDLQYALLPGLLIGLAIFFVAIIYLLIAAGHGRDADVIRPGGLNCLPLDLYSAGAIAGVAGLFVVGIELMDMIFYEQDFLSYPGLMILAALPFVGAALLAVAYLFALAAQFKAGNGYWWRNSVIGRCLKLTGRCCRWLWRSGIRMLSLMNAMWQWLLIGGALCFGWFLVVLWRGFLPLLFMLAVTAAVVGYGAYAFGIILQGARRMADGDLNRNISTKYLIGCFADCAGQLNALADVAVVAARRQMRSDRMKTELITNVSHDIKTPLTSIINYVDLLQKPHTEEEGAEYLAVLSRQSDRMKKLIEDLMDMSKATTGNMAVDITEMDAVEAVNQALGEFSDKLAAVPLYPVVRCPESPVMIRADGKLLWRTLSNLLQNAVKYALPGTRLYVDIARVEGNVVISLKNISREELNISADELMERFVRGDASRNTEGSGLGLNIARSLMELQKGQLRLLVDGDLFKTSLVFPAEE